LGRKHDSLSPPREPIHPEKGFHSTRNSDNSRTTPSSRSPPKVPRQREKCPEQLCLFR
jgi:hypothetical protein